MSNGNTATPVEFYFDFLSPYSYLAWSWVRQSHFNLVPVPVVLAQVIHHYETKGPAEIAPKRDYLWKHCLRTARQRQVPFVMPAKLPFNSSFALRVAIASGGDLKVIDAIFRAAWERAENIEDPEVVLQLPECAHLDALASSKETRRALKNNVQMAIQKGVFGTPTFVVNDELFWGDDCKDHLQAFMAGGDTLDREAFETFSERFGQ